MSENLRKRVELDDPYFGDKDREIGFSRVWFNLLRVQRVLAPKIGRVLREEGIGDPVWFEILELVDEAGSAGCPMNGLEERLFLPQYAQSRHVARMEKAGFLRREVVADGRRKQILFVTDTAMGLHARVWPKYFAAIKSEIGGRLDEEDAYALARLLIHLTY